VNATAASALHHGNRGSSRADYAVTTFVTTVVTCHRGTSRSWPRPAPRGQTRSGRGGVGPSPSRPLPLSSGSCQNPERVQVEQVEHHQTQQAADAGDAAVAVLIPTRDTTATSAVSTATKRRRTEVRGMATPLSRVLDWASGPMLTDVSQFLHLSSATVRKEFSRVSPSGGSRGPFGGRARPFGRNLV
jgi:hypothetical protein